MAIVASLMGAWLTRRLGIKRIFLLSLCADLLTPFALLVGVTTVAMFAMHGGIYPSMKTDGEQQARIRRLIPRLMIVFFVLNTLVVIGMFPNLLISTTNPQYNLTIHNSASAANTLTVLLVFALIGMPSCCCIPQGYITSFVARLS
jgi:cytochrome bd-type quinol oxidase subunit 2